MAKKEAKTDLWVYDLLKDANIFIRPARLFNQRN